MVYSPGELPKRLEGSHFFAQESQQLQLTPPVAQRFREIVEELIGEFEQKVNGTSDEFIQILKEKPTPRTILQHLDTTQAKLDQLKDHFLDRVKSLLEKQVGHEYHAAIQQFVKDLGSQLTEHTALEKKIRSHPELSQLMPPRSIFDVAFKRGKETRVKPSDLTPQPPKESPKEPSETPQLEPNILNILQQKMVQQLAIRMGIEGLIADIALQSKVTLMPPYIQQMANKILDTSHIHIEGYTPGQTVPPGEPLPTNNWWTLLADDRGSGILGLQVVPDNQPIEAKDVKTYIHLSDAKLFDPQAHIGDAQHPYIVTVPYPEAFPPNVNQGAYTIKNDGNGFEFNQSETFSFNSNGSANYSQLTPYSIVAGAREDLLFPPTVTQSDDHSVTLVYQTKQGGSLTVPIVRGSPYLTFQYNNISPYFNSTSTPIDMNSVHAFFYKQVVADGQVSDPKTQISQTDAKNLGLDGTLNAVDLVPNLNGPPWTVGIEGQLFSYSMQPSGTIPGDTYRLYFSSPVTLNPCNYVTETVVPDSVPIPDPNPNNYIHDSSRTPYTTEQVNLFSRSRIATGLEASAPFSGTVRSIKIPNAAAQGAGGSSLMQQTLAELNSLIEAGKGMGDLKLWAMNLLANTNFLQSYPALTADEFYQFCSLTGTDQMDAEKFLAQTWLNRIPMPPSDKNKSWYQLATLLNDLLTQGQSAAYIQQWLLNIMNSQDFQQLDPSNQQFLKTFSQFSNSPLKPSPSLKDSLTQGLNFYHTEPADLNFQTLALFDKDAWTIPLSGHYQVDGLGRWSYTYTVDTTVNPYQQLHFKNPPPSSSGHILIGLLKTDFSYLDGTHAISDKIYFETIKGELEFVETQDNTISFYDKGTSLAWPDDDLAKLSPQDQLNLAQQYLTQVVPNLWLPDRHSNQVTYYMGKDIQNAADVAHALWKLAQLNPEVAKLPGFSNGLAEATQIAEAGLDDYVTGGLLAYDSTNGMMISTFGQTGEYVDFSNAYGEDHHFAYGYLIRAAAELRQVDPGWFQDPKYGAQRTGMVNLMINDIFNIQNNPNFPRMRMWDPYIGIGRATGLVPPAGNGMNEESTAEDYNCIQGIAMWAHTDGNADLENAAATMAKRVINAAQAYWQPSSSTSIYTDADAPQAAKDFAAKVISCGVNWDNLSSSANFFTPANGDPNIFTIAIEYITGNPNFADPKTALAAFNYLINQNDSSGFARLFQHNISPSTPGAAGYFSFISILIPLIAKTSPNAALAILNWFQRANQLSPNTYSYDDGTNYGTIYQQILIAKATHTTADPYPSPDSFNSKLPPLPSQDPNPITPLDIVNGGALWYLSAWDPLSIYSQLMPQVADEVEALKKEHKYSQAALDDWIENTLIAKYPNQGLTVGGIEALFDVYTHMSTSGQALMKALVTEIAELKKSGPYTIQALRDWIQNSLLPTLKQKYPDLNSYDITAFCKATQMDLHAFD